MIPRPQPIPANERQNKTKYFNDIHTQNGQTKMLLPSLASNIAHNRVGNRFATVWTGSNARVRSAPGSALCTIVRNTVSKKPASKAVPGDQT